MISDAELVQRQVDDATIGQAKVNDPLGKLVGGEIAHKTQYSRMMRNETSAGKIVRPSFYTEFPSTYTELNGPSLGNSTPPCANEKSGSVFDNTSRWRRGGIEIYRNVAREGFGDESNGLRLSPSIFRASSRQTWLR